MLNINNDRHNRLVGIIYKGNEIVGSCDNAETFLDILCQIKDMKANDYRMEVEVEKGNVKKTYVYRFTEDGKMIPSSYPNVFLWTDVLNKKLLYLYGFSISHEFCHSSHK